MSTPSYAGLVARLPRSFGPSLNDQLRRWGLLFPAEQHQLRSQLDYLAGLSPGDLKSLFAPLAELESRMSLPNGRPGAVGVSIEETGILARSPLYPQWRIEVEKVFSEIESAIEKSMRPKRFSRLLVCILPSGLPLDGQPVWPDLSGQGTWVTLSKPFRESENALVAALSTRPDVPGLEVIESTWVIECGRDLSTVVESTNAIGISWSSLEVIRRTFLDRLNGIHRDLHSADQTTDELRRIDISQLLDPRLGRSPRVCEFIRSILLTGNGSLVFNNSFVQWSASEALRRVQPQVLVARFGVRPRIKPFSSLVLFEDQNRSNPTPDQDDPSGSLIDGQMLASYVYFTARDLAAYQDQLVTLFACADLSRLLVVGSKAATAHFTSTGREAAATRLETQQLSTLALSWLART